LEFSEEHTDFKVKFMSPNGPSQSYIWLEVKDICWKLLF